MLKGRLTDHNPFVPRSGRTTFQATIFLRSHSIRVDFSGPAGERGMLLHDGNTGKAWLADLGDRFAVPVDSAATRSFASLIVDAQTPCARIPVRCEPVPPRFVAGESRKGYRFRSAAGKGPGGLSDGEFWIDDVLGVVVAYRGLGLSAREAPSFEADFVVIDTLPDTYFELPDIETPGSER